MSECLEIGNIKYNDIVVNVYRKEDVPDNVMYFLNDKELSGYKESIKI